MCEITENEISNKTALLADAEKSELTERILSTIKSTGNLLRLEKVMEKAKRGEVVTVAYLGGSITKGCAAVPQEINCYAYLATQWWKKMFPDAEINYVNAGIGATDSYLGVHRVAEDVLSKNPDLVVVEFSVNDYRNHNKESYESLMRRILKYKTNPAVVSLCLTQFSEGGQCIDYGVYHKAVADYYHIPVVSYGDAVRPGLEDGTIQWSQLGPSDDLTHPSNAGHKIISRCLSCFYKQVLEDMKNHSYGDYGTYEMPKGTITKSRYENGTILDHRSGSKESICVSGSDVYKATVQNAQFPYGWQTDSGSDIIFTIKDSTDMGLIYYGGMEENYGIFDVYVDNCYINTVDSCFYGSWGSHAEYILLLTGKAKTPHTVRITKNENSRGNTFIVLGFTVSNPADAIDEII